MPADAGSCHVDPYISDLFPTRGLRDENVADSNKCIASGENHGRRGTVLTILVILPYADRFAFYRGTDRSTSDSQTLVPSSSTRCTSRERDQIEHHDLDPSLQRIQVGRFVEPILDLLPSDFQGACLWENRCATDHPSQKGTALS
jgi:hypothetical protein